MTQPELFDKRPKVTGGDVELLLAILATTPECWVPAVAIEYAAKSGYEVNWSDRKIRAIASASEGQIISGQNGYRLTRQAAEDEIRHSANWLRHQAGEMARRAAQIEQVYQNV